WSMAVMTRELNQFYGAYCNGRVPELAPAELQYGDFAVWQRQLLQGGILQRQLVYWKAQLEGMMPLELPPDYSRGARPGIRGARLSFRLESQHVGKLKDLNRNEGTTLFIILLAAFQLVLGSYAGRTDVAVGTDIANRNWPGTEGMIGFFVNQLV